MQPTGARQPIRLRSPLARAVVPVLAGIGVIVLIGLFTWGMAAYISGGGGEASETLAPTRFEVGSTQNVANIVERDGPIMLPGLNTTTGERTFILNHRGDDPAKGWTVYAAYPADHDPSCNVEQDPQTGAFTDCDGDSIDVTDLAPPPAGVNPVVEGGRTLVLDLRGVTETTIPA